MNLVSLCPTIMSNRTSVWEKEKEERDGPMPGPGERVVKAGESREEGAPSFFFISPAGYPRLYKGEGERGDLSAYGGRSLSGGTGKREKR